MSCDLLAIRASVSREEARDVIRRIAPVDSSPRVERELFYPYFWFLLRCRTEAVLGTDSVRVSCLIDSRTRVGATTDPFEVDRLRAKDSDVMPGLLPEHEALRLATRYTGHVLRTRRKALVAPRVTVLKRLAVYKPFWIVASGVGSALRGIVDATSGAFHPLDM